AGISDIVEVAVGIDRQRTILARNLVGAVGHHALAACSLDGDDRRGSRDAIGTGRSGAGSLPGQGIAGGRTVAAGGQDIDVRARHGRVVFARSLGSIVVAHVSPP